MIELNIHQKQSLIDNDLLNTPADIIVNELLKSLTLPQIKQLAEQHNADVIEWVEFNENTAKHGYCFVQLKNGLIKSDFYIAPELYFESSRKESVAKILYLPQ